MQLVGLPRHYVLKLVRAHAAYYKRGSSKLGGRPIVLSSLEEVLLILLHLRHYPVDLFLGSMFQLPVAHVAKVYKVKLVTNYYQLTN